MTHGKTNRTRQNGYRRASGKTITSIAKEYGVSRQTDHTVLKDLKAADPNQDLDGAAYRNRRKRKSIAAVEAGLDDPADNYKRANIGIKTMKGIGEFSDGKAQVNVQFQQVLATIPPRLIAQRVPHLILNSEDASPELRAIAEKTLAEQDERERLSLESENLADTGTVS